jgi:hypothetical protein
MTTTEERFLPRTEITQRLAGRDRVTVDATLLASLLGAVRGSIIVFDNGGLFHTAEVLATAARQVLIDVSVP